MHCTDSIDWTSSSTRQPADPAHSCSRAESTESEKADGHVIARQGERPVHDRERDVIGGRPPTHSNPVMATLLV